MGSDFPEERHVCLDRWPGEIALIADAHGRVETGRHYHINRFWMQPYGSNGRGGGLNNAFRCRHFVLIVVLKRVNEAYCCWSFRWRGGF